MSGGFPIFPALPVPGILVPRPIVEVIPEGDGCATVIYLAGVRVRFVELTATDRGYWCWRAGFGVNRWAQGTDTNPVNALVNLLLELAAMREREEVGQ